MIRCIIGLQVDFNILIYLLFPILIRILQLLSIFYGLIKVRNFEEIVDCRIDIPDFTYLFISATLLSTLLLINALTDKENT